MSTAVFLAKDIHARCNEKDAFIKYYLNLYRGWTKEQLGFDPENLEKWLMEQFAVNVGEFFIVDTSEPEIAFLTFSITSHFINIYQIIGNDTQKTKLIQFLIALYPQKRFYGVIRKANKAGIAYYLKKGCKIVENRLPNYDSEYYSGLEMDAETLF